MIVRTLARMLILTVIRGSVREKLERTDPGERRRIYTYIALCIAGVILVSLL